MESFFYKTRNQFKWKKTGREKGNWQSQNVKILSVYNLVPVAKCNLSSVITYVLPSWMLVTLDFISCIALEVNYYVFNFTLPGDCFCTWVAFVIDVQVLTCGKLSPWSDEVYCFKWCLYVREQNTKLFLQKQEKEKKKKSKEKITWGKEYAKLCPASHFVDFLCQTLKKVLLGSKCLSNLCLTVMVYNICFFFFIVCMWLS